GGGGGGEAVRAALAGGDGAALGLFAGDDVAFLGVDRLDLDVAFFVLPVEPDDAHVDLPAGDRLPIEIGGDRVDLERLALLHEGPVELDADVDARRMHEEVRGRGPGLPVHVHHR